MVYLTELQRQKNDFKYFLCEIWKPFLYLQFFVSFLNISFLFDLFTNQARKLKVRESNQAKARLTKPWLANEQDNRSPVVSEQFGCYVILCFRVIEFLVT